MNGRRGNSLALEHRGDGFQLAVGQLVNVHGYLPLHDMT
jgi:hypothetical protein